MRKSKTNTAEGNRRVEGPQNPSLDRTDGGEGEKWVDGVGGEAKERKRREARAGSEKLK